MRVALRLKILAALIGLIGMAIRDPRPHDIPVGLVGPAAAVQQMSTAFGSAASGAFQRTPHASEAGARAALDSRAVDGALVIGGASPRLIVAGAAGDGSTGAPRPHSSRARTATPPPSVAYGTRATSIDRPSDPDKAERLRGICLALPGVTERLSHGELAWFVGGKLFVTTSDHHHDDRLGLWCAAPEGAQEMLVKAAPDRFFRPPYVGHRGWLGVYLDVDVDWEEIAGVVYRAYRHIAPKRLLAELEGRGIS